MRVSLEDEEFPPQLRKIKDPPNCLYCKGNITLLQKIGIAIIGSRSCSDYGRRMAIKFSKDLCEYGITIISGMAIGIDSFAHKGALEVGGETIAVLPSGLNNIYPKQNVDLYNEILKKNGLIITEYEDDVEADSKKFLERNRIVSGLSIGILVVEGGIVSGTSVTARLAKEQGKEIFCIPSSLENNKGIIPNKLIKNGANLVTDVEDIINKFEAFDFKKIISENKNINCGYKVSNDNKNRKNKIETKKVNDAKVVSNINVNKKQIDKQFEDIYNLLEKNECMNIEEINLLLNLNIKDISSKLLLMELNDLVVSLPGKNYKLK